MRNFNPFQKSIVFIACVFMFSSFLASEEDLDLAWLGYLNLPKRVSLDKGKIKPTQPMLWKEWKLEVGERLDWLPRHHEFVDVVGTTLNVLPKGLDLEKAPRRRRHQGR